MKKKAYRTKQLKNQLQKNRKHSKGEQYKINSYDELYMLYRKGCISEKECEKPRKFPTYIYIE